MKRPRPGGPGLPSSSSLPKRPRRPPAVDEPISTAAVGGGGRSSAPSLVMVTGLPQGCTVLDLKSRLQIYGPISRTRIDVDGYGYVTFRSDAAAEAAIAASLDQAFGVTVRSKRVLVIRGSEPPPQRSSTSGAPTQSKSLRAEIPLRKHDGSNKKLATGTRSTNESDRCSGRGIVAYDDLL